MCRYEFYHFRVCQHYGIEVLEYCQRACFQGGLTGMLQLCWPDVLFGRGNPCHLLPIPWRGVEGFCRICGREYVVRNSSPDVLLPDPVFMETRVFHSVPTNFDQNRKGPYIFVPRLEKTIPELLGIPPTFIEKLVRAKDRNGCTRTDKIAELFTVVFPRRLERGSWGELAYNLPWRSKGQWRPEVAPSTRLQDAHAMLHIDSGVTYEDMAAMKRLLDANLGVERLWKHYYRPRGMDLTHFRFTVLRALFLQGHPNLENVNSDLNALTDIESPPESLESDDSAPELGDGSPAERLQPSL